MAEKKRIYKKKKRVSGFAAVYRKWNEWDVGDILIGKYVGKREDNYEKDNYLVEVQDAQFSDKKAAKKLMPKEDGEPVVIGLNYTGKLASAMKNVEEGDEIQLEYQGTTALPKGHKFYGKDVHDMDVDILESEDEDEEQDEDESDEESEDDEDEDEDDDL